MLAFSGFALIHSLVLLSIDLFLYSETVRILAWARQAGALVLGMSLFLVLRVALSQLSDRLLPFVIVAGALPALGLAGLNVLWGRTGATVLGGIVTGVRSIFGLQSWEYRVSGLSLEPAHFAFYLVSVVVPAVLMGFLVSQRKLAWAVIAGVVLLAHLATQSATGLALAGCLAVSGVLLGPRRRVFAIATIVLVLAFYSVVRGPADNYARRQLSALISGSCALAPDLWTVIA